MRRILIITSSFPYGSGEGFLVDELEALGRIAKIFVAPLHPRGGLRNIKPCEFEIINGALFSFENISAFLSEIIRNPYRTICLIQLILFKSKNFFAAIKNLSTIPTAVRLSNYVAKNQVDHIHCHWAAYTSTCGMIAAHLSSVQWSFTCHRWDIYYNDLLKEKILSSKFARFISKRGMQDAFLLTGEKDNCEVIHMGVKPIPQRECCSLKPGSKLHIVCAANLVKIKGHHYLFSALNILMQRRVSFFLHLFGDGPLRYDLINLSQKFGIREYIAFHGHVDRESLMDFYSKSNCSLFVLYSVESSGGEHEGIPVSIIEAINSGLVAIASDTGSISELLPRNALVKQRNPDDLASKILHVTSNVDTYNEMKKEQYDIVKKWSSEHVARELLFRINCID